MVRALLISEKDLKEETVLDENIDMKLLKPIISTTQELKVPSWLGKVLYDKLQDDVVASGSPSGNYLTLLTDYVQPTLKAYIMFKATILLVTKYRNKAVAKQNSDNAIALDIQNMELARDLWENEAEAFEQRLKDHLCANTDKYPEYLECITGEVKRSNNVLRGGIYFGRRHGTQKTWQEKDQDC